MLWAVLVIHPHDCVSSRLDNYQASHNCLLDTFRLACLDCELPKE